MLHGLLLSSPPALKKEDLSCFFSTFAFGVVSARYLVISSFDDMKSWNLLKGRSCSLAVSVKWTSAHSLFKVLGKKKKHIHNFPIGD